MNELRVLAFLDISNLVAQAKQANRRIDFEHLKSYIASQEEGRRLVDCYAYATLPPESDEKVIRWHDYLRHSGYVVVSKRAKRLPDGRIKADMDMELGLDALELGLSIRPDIVVLGTGDGDMATVALRLRRHGIRIEVLSSTNALAAELRAAGHGTIDFDDFLARCEFWSGHRNAEAIGCSDILEAF